MNIKQIRQLARILGEEGLTVLEVSEGENRIRLERDRSPAGGRGSAGGVPQAAPQAAIDGALLPQGEITLPAIGGEVDFNDIKEVKSPMVGVFYQASSPEAKPFVQVGDKVKKGDVLCIIEAMKILNEIAAEADGEVVDICALDGQIVEFGQTIFKLF